MMEARNDSAYDSTQMNGLCILYISAIGVSSKSYACGWQCLEHLGKNIHT